MRGPIVSLHLFTMSEEGGINILSVFSTNPNRRLSLPPLSSVTFVSSWQDTVTPLRQPLESEGGQPHTS